MVQAFEAQCRRRRVALCSWQEADIAMAEYFADLYEEGVPYNDASYTLYGYLLLRTNEDIPERQLYPRARGALKG